MISYQFLLMDADNTLLDFDSDMYHAFSGLYQEKFAAQRPFSQSILDCYEKHNNLWWAKFEGGECTKPELFSGRFRDFLKETGLSGNPQELNDSYFRHLGRGGRLLPGALELVQRLSRQSEIYILTNGNASSQKTRLENSGLLTYVQDFFISEEVGVGKPDIRYFEYAFSGIPGFDKSGAIVIGDSLSSDIQGANQAELPSIWYNPQGLPNPRRIPYTFEAKSFAEMENFLNGSK